VLVGWCKPFYGRPQHPELDALVASGLFEECASAVAAFAAAGVEGLHDTASFAIGCALAILRNCRHQPDCEAMIRSLAPALEFCLENDLEMDNSFGVTTAVYGAQLCEFPCVLSVSCQSELRFQCLIIWSELVGCGVFGRDEGGSEFSFTQQQVDLLLTRWSHNVRADGIGGINVTKPSATTIQVAELCISDKHKPLLLANPSFIPYAVDALLLVRIPVMSYSHRSIILASKFTLRTVPPVPPGPGAPEGRHEGGAQGMVSGDAR